MKEGTADVADRPQQATMVLVVASAIFILLMGLFSGPVFTLFEKSLS
jgi:hypothetical protein